MKLKDKYKVLYEVMENGQKVFYVSEDTLFKKAEEDKVSFNADQAKLRTARVVFEKNNKIFARYADGTEEEVQLIADGENIFEVAAEETQEEENQEEENNQTEEPVVETPTETPVENPTQDDQNNENTENTDQPVVENPENPTDGETDPQGE